MERSSSICHNTEALAGHNLRCFLLFLPTVPLWAFLPRQSWSCSSKTSEGDLMFVEDWCESFLCHRLPEQTLRAGALHPDSLHPRIQKWEGAPEQVMLRMWLCFSQSWACSLSLEDPLLCIILATEWPEESALHLPPSLLEGHWICSALCQLWDRDLYLTTWQLHRAF